MKNALQRTVGLISLGCAKNLVDAEIMIGHALQHGYQLTKDNDNANILLINTCGFIDLAKKESIDTILEAHRRRLHSTNCYQKIVVSGCLSQRYAKDLLQQLPEVDAFIGLDELEQVGLIFDQLLSEDNHLMLKVSVSKSSLYIPDYDTPRARLTEPHTAYLKIAEGCNHPCSFCVIPQMRGKHRSRTISSIIQEAELLIQNGVKEINLISQDTTYYGMDRWMEKAGPKQQIDQSKGECLPNLLDALNNIPGDFWIRLLYTHPAHWSESMIHAVARNHKVVRYIDMPIQHINDEMLKSMRRETNRKHIENLIIKMREIIPDITLRTTFIVGFPGETEDHFNDLLNFISTVRFERMGIFQYSREEKSRAAKFENQVHPSTKKRRYKEAMMLQMNIAYQNAKQQIGKTVRVLADTENFGRSQGDAPDIDCRICFSAPVKKGVFHIVKIIKTADYDLVGETFASN